MRVLPQNTPTLLLLNKMYIYFSTFYHCFLFLPQYPRNRTCGLLISETLSFRIQEEVAIRKQLYVNIFVRGLLIIININFDGNSIILVVFCFIYEFLVSKLKFYLYIGCTFLFNFI